MSLIMRYSKKGVTKIPIVRKASLQMNRIVKRLAFFTGTS